MQNSKSSRTVSRAQDFWYSKLMLYLTVFAILKNKYLQ